MPRKGTTLPRFCKYCGQPFRARADAVKVGRGVYCSRSCAARDLNPRHDVPSRFWSKVLKSDGCWEWQAGRLSSGYGMFWRGDRSYGAHRVAFELAYGPISDGLFVCHHCDNPACVRPDHLFLGTQKDNRIDCVRKGRQAKGGTYWSAKSPEKLRRGEDHHWAKLTAEQVHEIRTHTEVTGADMARRLGISRTTVYDIRNHKIWRHI